MSIAGSSQSLCWNAIGGSLPEVRSLPLFKTPELCLPFKAYNYISVFGDTLICFVIMELYVAHWALVFRFIFMPGSEDSQSEPPCLGTGLPVTNRSRLQSGRERGRTVPPGLSRAPLPSRFILTWPDIKSAFLAWSVAEFTLLVYLPSLMPALVLFPAPL